MILNEGGNIDPMDRLQQEESIKQMSPTINRLEQVSRS